MKLDKDTLIKQRFWLVLGLSVPLALVGFFLLSSSVPAQIKKENDKVVEAFKKIEQFTREGPKSKEWVDQAEKVAQAKEKQKTDVWKTAAEEQADLMTWPREMEKKYHFRDGLFAREIAVTGRKKEDKKEEASPAPAKEDDRHFSGTITSASDISITVAKGKTEKTFLGSAEVKVTIAGEAGAGFQSLQVGDHVTVTFEKGKYFGDKLTDNEQGDYIREYKTQIPEIIESVEPVNAKGEGVVQFGNPLGAGASGATWVWDGHTLPPKAGVDGLQRFLRYVAEDWKREQDISDEAWLAQEDLWIQREIYRLIRVANDKVASFDGKGGADRDTDYAFTNPYWHLTCRVTSEGNLQVKLKNLQDQRQYLSNLAFLFQLSPDGSLKRQVTIEGMPLAPAGAADGKDTVEKTFTPAQLGGAPPRGVFGVKQLLNWRTAAVKRIDNVRIGSTDQQDCAAAHRYCGSTLKKLREPKKDPNAQDSNPLQGIVAPGAPGAPPTPQAGGVPDELTPNGLIQNRYLQFDNTPQEVIKQQARRLPVGVVLIVGQQHVERVLTSFANSKLRFLTTQVVLNRYPDTVRPDIFDPSAPQTPGIAVSNRRPRMAFDRTGGAAGGPTTGGGGAGGSEEQESNMELCIYGIVTLYDRFSTGARGPGPTQ